MIRREPFQQKVASSNVEKRKYTRFLRKSKFLSIPYF
uniref:Uncharacterized protein n=1 Tax=Myoviridae sp. ctakU3 TaxID=2825135 RepID=A0A8S5P1X8_9CAUD|nr:MAG TPA: hypothetical protein [Myoviridae sp. ctakU3]